LLRFSFNFFLQVFCKSGLGLVLALRLVLQLRLALITATKIVVGVVFDGTRFLGFRLDGTVASAL